jgi:phenylacetate-CoA ligase
MPRQDQMRGLEDSESRDVCERMKGHPKSRAGEASTAIHEAYYIARLSHLQYASPGSIQRHQAGRLAGALKRARSAIPRYARSWPKASLGDPFETLRSLPILTKRGIVGKKDELIVPGSSLAGEWKNSTSGSSGTPSIFYFDWRTARVGKGLSRFTMLQSGWRPWHRLVADYTRSPTPSRWYEKLGHMRTIRIWTFEPAAESVQRLREFRPHTLYQLPSHLQLICQEIIAQGDKLGLRSVCTNGETLYDSQRSLIEEVFGVEPRDQYGSAEFPRIAWECEQGAYHILPELVVEILDDDGEPVGQGERGRVVCTDIHNRIMPLIRYDIGDIATNGSDDRCRCGRTLPTLLRVEGKEDGFLIAKDGQLVTPRALDGSLASSPEVLMYEAHQRHPGRLTLKLVLAQPEMDPESLPGIKVFRSGLGGRFDVELAVVDDLPLHGSGKRKTVVNEIPAARAAP